MEPERRLEARRVGGRCDGWVGRLAGADGGGRAGGGGTGRWSQELNGWEDVLRGVLCAAVTGAGTETPGIPATSVPPGQAW